MNEPTLSSEARTDIARLHEGRMNDFKQMAAAGGTLAVPAALNHCVEYQVQAPSWLLEAALDLLCDLLRRETSHKRGRSAGAIARYRQDLVDLMRWGEVDELLRKQRCIRECFQSDPNFPEGRSSDELDRAEWLGETKSKVFECVADVLERTDAFGSPCSIKRSYLHVERRMKGRSTAAHYCWIDHPFLQKLGIEGDLGYGRHATIAAWRKSKPRSKRAVTRKR
jgi:hypothetical protein